MAALPWSATRARTFQDCGRKYDFRYHLAPLARKPDAPAQALAADRVKDLMGLEGWAGELVHSVIERILNRWRAGMPVSAEETVQYAVGKLSSQFRDSRDYWTGSAEEFPYRPSLLDLHYYSDGKLSKDRAAALKQTVTSSIRSFLESDLAGRIRTAGPQAWLPIDRNAAARLDEEDVLILVKPDFAFREGDLLHILDWKTGKPDPYWERLQVNCYALYAVQKWNVDWEQVVPRIIHLYPEFREAEREYTGESREEARRIIRESQGEILAAVGDETLPAPERFPLTSECRRCGWCQFRGICEGAGRDAAEGNAAL